MNFYTHLRGISHSNDLILKMEAWADETFNLKLNKNLKINVYMTKTVSKGQLANKQFECHIMAEAPWLQKNIFIKHKDEDFWPAYTQGAKKIIHRIQKEKQKYERSKVRQLKANQKLHKKQDKSPDQRDEWKTQDNTNLETY